MTSKERAKELKNAEAACLKECYKRHDDVLAALRVFQYQVGHADDNVFSKKEDRRVLLQSIANYPFKFAHTHSALPDIQTNMRLLEETHWPEIKRRLSKIELKEPSNALKFKTLFWQYAKDYKEVMTEIRAKVPEEDMRFDPVKLRENQGILGDYDLTTGRRVRGDGWVESNTYQQRSEINRKDADYTFDMRGYDRTENPRDGWVETNISKRLAEPRRELEDAMAAWREADKKYQEAHEEYRKALSVHFALPPLKCRP